jgi:hypothetical protein
MIRGLVYAAGVLYQDIGMAVLFLIQATMKRISVGIRTPLRMDAAWL